jgi:hypothetical protein
MARSKNNIDKARQEVNKFTSNSKLADIMAGVDDPQNASAFKSDPKGYLQKNGIHVPDGANITTQEGSFCITIDWSDWGIHFNWCW